MVKEPKPERQRCKGVYTGKRYQDKAGQQCEQLAPPGREYCGAHHLPDERRCTANYSPKNKDGKTGRCTGRALKGQTVCAFHGGSTKRSKAAAARRIAEGKAQKLVETYGRKIETTASEALLEEVKWTAGHVAWLRERVQEIETAHHDGDGEGPLVWGTVRRKSGGEDWGETEEAAPNIWLKLYQAERAHLVKVCSEAIRAGIEERRVKLAEQQGSLVAEVIRAILGDLNLSAEQQARVPEVVPRHLRAIAS